MTAMKIVFHPTQSILVFVSIFALNHVLSRSCLLNLSDIEGNRLHWPGTAQYLNSVVQANYACNQRCPDCVVRPRNVFDASQAIRRAAAESLPVSIRGGGHGYTCQASKVGGIMLDMRSMSSIEVHKNPKPYMIVGSGATWNNILHALKKYELITVHGQCTSVGVAGFSLHGRKYFLTNLLVTSVNHFQ